MGEQESAERASDCTAAVRKSQNKDCPVEDSLLSKNGPALVPPPPSIAHESSFCMNIAIEPPSAKAGAHQRRYSATLY